MGGMFNNDDDDDEDSFMPVTKPKAQPPSLFIGGGAQ
jgi:hypothetical protein